MAEEEKLLKGYLIQNMGDISLEGYIFTLPTAHEISCLITL